jgi:hypothetical protein
MLRGSRLLGKVLGYSFLAQLRSTSRCSDLSRRVGRGDIWRRQWELLENRVYNKPNGCSATGALAPGPDHHHNQQQQRRPVYRADNLTTFMCRLSWNLGASTSWNPRGLSRPVMGLLCLYLYLKFLGVSSVTWIRYNSANPQISGANVQHTFALAAWRPGLAYPFVPSMRLVGGCRHNKPSLSYWQFPHLSFLQIWY